LCFEIIENGDTAYVYKYITLYLSWIFICPPPQHRVQTGSGAHPASYPMGAGVNRSGREADHSPPANIEVV